MNKGNKKKDSRISGYFSACVISGYFNKNKLPQDFIKNAAIKLKVPQAVCRKELKKARLRFYHRIAYLKKNPKLLSLATLTGIEQNKLIELILRGDIKFTKSSVNSFMNIYYVVESSLANINQPVQDKDERERLSKMQWFNLKKFIIFLVQHINRVSGEKKYISAIELDDSIFFSLYSLSSTFRQVAKKYVYGINNAKVIKKFLTLLIKEFRDNDLLARKINAGYYSNTVLIYEEGSGKKGKKAHGIFLKKSAFDAFVLPPIPDIFKKVKIIIAKV